MKNYKRYGPTLQTENLPNEPDKRKKIDLLLPLTCLISKINMFEKKNGYVRKKMSKQNKYVLLHFLFSSFSTFFSSSLHY